MPAQDIIVIGGSAGGLEALTSILVSLPRNLKAAIFAVLHTSPQSGGSLPQILERNASLPAKFPGDGERVKLGTVYVAPPDNHLTLEDGKIMVHRGPRENGFRPAVDPLFRSAARSYDGRVVGVILSGAMDDGTFGLIAVKQAGGAAIEGPFDGEEGITLMADLDAGATGSMTSATLPDLIRPAIAAHLAGRRAEAAAIYARLLPLINFENRQCGWRSCKVVMKEGGVIASEHVRHPTRPLHPATRAQLLELAREVDPLALRWG